jgi:hypothetical protein
MRRVYSLIVITLLICLFIYLFYRSEKTVVNELMILFLSLDTFSGLRGTISNAIPLNELIIFSLPGGLWVFCTTALAEGLYMKIGKYKLQLVCVPVLFAVSLEFCQLLNITHGTFDLWDIACYFVFWSFAHYWFESRNPQQNILSSFTVNGFICVACFLSVYLAHVSQ